MKVKENEVKGKRPLIKSIRSLHRDIGFFVIGLTIIYSLSGILLIYRDTDFMKQEQQINRTIEPNKQAAELGSILRLRELKILNTEDNIVYFENGKYNQKTGEVEYTSKELPVILNKLTSFHKAISGKNTHWFNLIFGILLFFMAVSSFFMFKSRTKLLRRGIFIAVGGLVSAIIFILL